MAKSTLFVAVQLDEQEGKQAFPRPLFIGNWTNIRAKLFDLIADSGLHLDEVDYCNADYEMIIRGTQERQSPAGDVMGVKTTIYVAAADILDFPSQD